MTEKSGRIHTSAVSVAILPQADEVLKDTNLCFISGSFFCLKEFEIYLVESFCRVLRLLTVVCFHLNI